MASFYPYDVEGYYNDSAQIMPLNAVDLKGRMPGDVLTEMLYAAPDGTVHPAMTRGCTARETREVSADRLARWGVLSGEEEGGSLAGSNEDTFASSARPLHHDPTLHPNPSRHAVPRVGNASLLVADARMSAKADLRAQQEVTKRLGPIVDRGANVDRLAAMARAAPRYGAARVVWGVTRCECKAIQDRARMRSALKATDNENYARFLKDFHARDDRWFSDGDRVAYEFFDMANASTLAVSLVRAGVISPPRFPLPILQGREVPCACSLIGPELVHKIDRLLNDDWERFNIARLPPAARNLGAILGSYNARVVAHFEADDELQVRGQAFEARAQAMVTGDGSSWDYNPLPAREPSNGRTNVVMDTDTQVTQLRREVAQNIAGRYGYTIDADGNLVQ
jgi:hypothetical protein